MQTSHEMDQKIFKKRFIKVKDIEAGIQKALDEKYAFVWGTEAMNVIVGPKCTHVAIKESVKHSVIAWPAKKDLPYMKLINY